MKNYLLLLAFATAIFILFTLAAVVHIPPVVQEGALQSSNADSVPSAAAGVIGLKKTQPAGNVYCDALSASCGAQNPKVDPRPPCYAAGRPCGGNPNLCCSHMCPSGVCCEPNGQFCGNNSECCEGSCITGQCCFGGVGTQCTNNTDCCQTSEPLTCQNGICDHSYCSQIGQQCGNWTYCCLGLSCSSQNLCCKSNGLSCLNSSQCCGGICAMGFCCSSQPGQPCANDSDCCQGANPTTCDAGICTEHPQCAQSGQSCDPENPDCCEGLACDTDSQQCTTICAQNQQCSDGQCMCPSGSCHPGTMHCEADPGLCGNAICEVGEYCGCPDCACEEGFTCFVDRGGWPSYCVPLE